MSEQFLRILNKTIRLPNKSTDLTTDSTLHINKKRKTFFDTSNNISDTKTEFIQPTTVKAEDVDTLVTTDKRQVRKELDIHVTTENMKAVPAPIVNWSQLHTVSKCTNTTLLSHIIQYCSSEYNTLTPIQAQCIPLFTQQLFDMLCCAPTGSGKTLAYVIPLLMSLNKPTTVKQQCRSIILCPTKELCDQINRVIVKLLHTETEQADIKFNICVLTRSTHNTVPDYTDIIISTPARLLQLTDNTKYDLSTVKYAILDEADKLFEMNFVEQIDRILVLCNNKQIKRHLYSATMITGIETLARSILQNPIRVTVGARNSAATQITQELVFVGKEEGKLLALRQYIANGLPVPMLIFVQSIDRAKQLYHELQYDKNINVDVIHSDKTAEQRHTIIRNFRLGNIYVLICTDILGRGIDFLNINCVINYDFPTSTTQYIHRIGRTGRSNRQGYAITLFTEQDKSLLRNIAEIVYYSGSHVPEWMLAEMPRIGKARGERLQQYGVPRKSISKELHQQQQENIKKLKTKTKQKKRQIEVEVTDNKKVAQSDNTETNHSSTKTINQSNSINKSTDKPNKQLKTKTPQDQLKSNKHNAKSVTKTIRKQSPAMIARNERRWQAKLAQLKADGLVQTTE